MRERAREIGLALRAHRTAGKFARWRGSRLIYVHFSFSMPDRAENAPWFTPLGLVNLNELRGPTLRC
jgi:hypothetical protein